MNTGVKPIGDPSASFEAHRTAALATDPPVAAALLLIVTQGEPAGACVEVGAVPSLVGRARDCTLPIQDLTASRHHCKVWLDGTTYFVQDLGAKNQTRVNGMPVAFSQIREGDELRVGITTIRLVSVQTAVRIAVLFSKVTVAGRADPA